MPIGGAQRTLQFVILHLFSSRSGGEPPPRVLQHPLITGHLPFDLEPVRCSFPEFEWNLEINVLGLEADVLFDNEAHVLG